MRPLKTALLLAASCATFTVAASAHAETVQLSGSCEYETGCSASCTAASINCNVQYSDSCSKSCTETQSDTCTTACAKQCTTTPGSFSCTDYCSGQCETVCSGHDNCGAANLTDCETDCQGQCSYSCEETPSTTSCTTECETSCKATENIQCAVSCQVKQSETCDLTPASCTASCNSGGGIISCNGQVVYVAATVADAASWYVAHIDAQFQLSASVSGSCTGDQCTATAKSACSAAPGTKEPAGGMLLLAGLALTCAARARRRSR